MSTLIANKSLQSSEEFIIEPYCRYIKLTLILVLHVINADIGTNRGIKLQLRLKIADISLCERESAQKLNSVFANPTERSISYPVLG